MLLKSRPPPLQPVITLLTHDLTLFSLLQRTLVTVGRASAMAPPPLLLGADVAELRPVLPISRLLVIDGSLLQGDHSVPLVESLDATTPSYVPWALVLPRAGDASLAPALLRAGRREIVTVVPRERAGNPDAWALHLRVALTQHVIERAVDSFGAVLSGDTDREFFTELFRVTPRVATVQELPAALRQHYRVPVGSTRTLARRLAELRAPSPNTVLGMFRVAHYRRFATERLTQEAIARALSYPSATAMRRSFQVRAGVRPADLRRLCPDRVLQWCAEQLQEPPELTLPERVTRLLQAA